MVRQNTYKRSQNIMDDSAYASGIFSYFITVDCDFQRKILLKYLFSIPHPKLSIMRGSLSFSSNIYLPGIDYSRTQKMDEQSQFSTTA